MSYIKIYNPESVDVKTGYLGEYYELAAKETKSFPEELAKRFVEIYPFITYAVDEEKEVEVKKVIKK